MTPGRPVTPSNSGRVYRRDTGVRPPAPKWPAQPKNPKDMRLMLPVLTTDDAFVTRVLEVVDNYLRPTDLVAHNYSILPTVAYEKFKGVYLATGGVAKDPLINAMPNIHPAINYITYDYEPQWCPEFSTDPIQTQFNFTQLRDACHANGHGFIPTPPYLYGQSWDWSHIGALCDILVLQVQNYQTGSKGPHQNKVVADVADIVNANLKALNPNCKLFFQLDTLVTQNVDYILSDIRSIYHKVDGLALWYNPTLNADFLTEQLPIFEAVVSHLR